MKWQTVTYDKETDTHLVQEQKTPVYKLIHNSYHDTTKPRNDGKTIVWLWDKPLAKEGYFLGLYNAMKALEENEVLLIPLAFEDRAILINKKLNAHVETHYNMMS